MRRRNKKKRMIILSIILFILALIATYIILVIKDILSNPLLDTRDLVCVRKDNYGDDVEYIFKFNKDAIVTSYKEIHNSILLTKEEAKEFFNLKKQNGENVEFIESENKVKSIYEFYVEENYKYYGMTKKQIKEEKITKYGWKCN